MQRSQPWAHHAAQSAETVGFPVWVGAAPDAGVGWAEEVWLCGGGGEGVLPVGGHGDALLCGLEWDGGGEV